MYAINSRAIHTSASHSSRATLFRPPQQPTRTSSSPNPTATTFDNSQPWFHLRNGSSRSIGTTSIINPKDGAWFRISAIDTGAFIGFADETAIVTFAVEEETFRFDAVAFYFGGVSLLLLLLFGSRGGHFVFGILWWNDEWRDN